MWFRISTRYRALKAIGEIVAGLFDLELFVGVAGNVAVGGDHCV